MKYRLKIFGGFIDGKRAIIGCYSRATVSAAIGESIPYVRRFWAESRNPNEIDLATLHPGTLFVETMMREPNFEKVIP